MQTALASYSLAAIANVENLTGTAATGQTLTGNGGANVITGGAGNDTLDGGAGADTLAGGGQRYLHRRQPERRRHRGGERGHRRGADRAGELQPGRDRQCREPHRHGGNRHRR